MLKFSFPKSSRILSSRHFKQFEREKEERSGSFIKVNIRKVHSQRQLGITVSRRFGKAHLRNRFKRIVREAFRLSQHELPSSIQLNVRPLPNAKDATTEEIQKDLLALTSLSFGVSSSRANAN